MIAADVDVLTQWLTDSLRADAVETSLRQCLGNGKVVVCDPALTRLCADLRGGADVLAALEETGIHYSALEAKSALRAGEMLRRHRQRNKNGAGSMRLITDFMIGAHALMQCDGLLTFDPMFYRDYFKGLKLIVPTE